ncbi:hypothetical protein NL108_003582 [Boleophthalmus pectinirostris]|nr:hypothetical protein NL108_003582 [Boleophthalmus pectinirostris]
MEQSFSAPERSFHWAITGVLLTIAAAEVVVAVSTPIATALVAVTTPIRPSVASIATAIAAAISVAVVSAEVSATVAILIPPHHASAASNSGSHRASCSLHLLLCQGLFHLHFVIIDRVVFDHDTLVGSIMVGEVNKTEASFLSGVFFRDDFGLLYFSKSGKMLDQVLHFNVFLQTTDKDFLNLGQSLGPVGIFSRHSSL